MLVAVDTGGTKTLVADFSKQGSIGRQARFATSHDTDEYVATLYKTIESMYGASRDIEAIIVGLPGRVEKDILVRARNLSWENFDIKAKLSAYYSCPILVNNDANLAGLGETRQLSPVPTSCLYITISTGIGTGIITDGVIDPYYTESEGGQMILEYEGILQRWENFGSGKAIHERYGKYARDITDEATWKEIANKISRGLLALIPTLRPELIIIGGSIGTYFDRYEKHLLDLLHEHLHYVPPIMAANHPEEAVIYGCYYYALDFFAST